MSENSLNENEEKTPEPPGAFSYDEPEGFFESPIVKIGAVFLAFKIVNTVAALARLKIRTDAAKVLQSEEKNQEE